MRRLVLVLLGVMLFLLSAAANGRELPTASITPNYYGSQGANGWYITNVTVNWVIEPLGYLGTEGCQATTIVTDTADTPLRCHAWWPDQTDINVLIHVHRDATAPTTTPIPARAPDANGWYNHAVAIGFSGADATSGIDACSQATYAGPDNPNATASGFCRDKAGNVGPASFTLKYDATAPTLGSLNVKPGNRNAKLLFSAQDASSIQIVRAPGLKGAAESVVFTGQGSKKTYKDQKLHPGRTYAYSLTATDQAGNQATKAVEYLARGALLNPAPGEQVTKPPLLVWAKKQGASYYNVILVRGRRIFSAWPVQARLQLARSWSYRGRKYKLRPGTYRWFVWPGYGPLSAGRYGKLLGGSTFKFGGSG